MTDSQIDYDDFASVIGAYNAWTLAVQQIKTALLTGKRTLFSKRLLEIRDLFEAIDQKRGGTGNLSLDDFVLGMRRLDVPLSDIQLAQVCSAGFVVA